jgi:hypothetical protein
VEHAFWRSLGGWVVMTQFDQPMGLPGSTPPATTSAPLHFEDNIVERCTCW